jgi:hypothetical protein
MVEIGHNARRTKNASAKMDGVVSTAMVSVMRTLLPHHTKMI